MAANASKDRKSNRLAQAGLAYGAAILLTGIAAFVRWLIDPWIGGLAQYTLFYPTVALVTVVWGWRAGLFGAILGVGVGWWLFMYHLGYTHSIPSVRFVQLGLYLATAGLIVALVEWGRRERQSSRRHAAELVSVAQFPAENPYPVLRIGHGGQVLYANGPAAALLEREGWKQGNPVPADLYDSAESALNDGHQREFEFVCREQRAMSFLCVPVRDKAYANLYGRDVTESKEAKRRIAQLNEDLERRNAELEAERARWQGVVEGIADEVWVCDAQGRMSLINLPPVTAMGLSEFRDKSVQEVLEEVEILHPDGRPRAPENPPLLRALRGEVVRGEEIVRHRASGMARWREFSAAPTRDASGGITGAVAIVHDMTEYKQAEEALRRSEEQLRVSEQRVRHKLDALLAPEGDIGALELADIIDVPAAQALMDEFYRLTRFPMSIIDLKGNVLVGVGWQEICLRFHRAHPEACRHCRESDMQLSAGLVPGEFRLYRCKNNMWDVATPIMVGGKHVGNLFSGQFFFDDEVVDRELFRSQARQYGFDEQEYLAALDAVPRLSREFVNAGMAFLMKLSERLSLLSYGNIQLVRSAEALAAAKRSAEHAKQAAEEASKAKDHFLAVLSHELRTPLTPVVAAVSMLQEQQQDEPTTREALEMIRRNVEMEARLIDDLLDVTRIIRGKVELMRQPTYLCEVIRRAAEVCMPDIETRQIHFGIDIGKDAPYRIEVDAARLQQVFWNLLKNAIKFTPHGGCIGVRCHREGGQVVIDVTDSGEGIDPVLLPKLFNAFEQGGARVTRQFGGLGLGLTITRGVVEMHGGTIEAYSEGKGKGATFRVRLPLCAGPEPLLACPPDTTGEAVLGRATPIPAPGPKLRILLVEDHGDTARAMQRLLMRRGHQVETAGDMTAALEMAETEPFDLLLSDLGLPDGSGVDLMRKLREHGRDLPGIALSGYGQEEDIRRSKEAGFSAHLTKPVNPDRLSATISAVTRKPSPVQEGGNDTAPPGMKAP